MSSTNRANRIEQLSKSLRKHFKLVEPVLERSMLEQLIYACCLEDARHEVADEAFAKLQQSYFDWNEVRVTTVAELSEVLVGLPDPAAAANRVKRNLQSMFETRYSFDIEEMRKMNLGKAVAELESWGGMTKFVIGYVTQHSLGGHAIPLSQSTMEVLRLTDVVTDTEADRGQAPGLDRAIPKAKGAEFSSLLHQMAAEFKAQPKNALVQAVFKDLGVSGKRKPVAPPPPVKKPPTKKIAAKHVPPTPPAKPVKSVPSKKAPIKKSVSTKRAVPPKTTKPSKAVSKPKASAKKSIPTKKSKSVTAKKVLKRKPR